jgi:ARG/rhodanese/phosphatase superfamily protein
MRASLLALMLSVTAVLSSSALPADEPVPDWRISDPLTYQNLAIFLIHGKDAHPGKFLTLQEALAEKKIVVHETGTVSQLAVENVSTDLEVFIQAGDIVKGGRQDRVLACDLIVPARSGQVTLASFCVESGRWQGRGAEDARQFSESSGQLPGKALRLAVSSARQQGQVWDKVKEQQDKLSRRLSKNVADPQSPTSLQLTLEDKELQAQINAYVGKLEKCIVDKPDAIGFVFSINGKVEGAEVYGSSALFRKMWPKLLRAAAVDAFGEHQKGRRYELADRDEIMSFLTTGSQARQTDTTVNSRVRVTRREGETSVSIESRDQAHQGALIHRSDIAR